MMYWSVLISGASVAMGAMTHDFYGDVIDSEPISRCHSP